MLRIAYHYLQAVHRSFSFEHFWKKKESRGMYIQSLRKFSENSAAIYDTGIFSFFFHFVLLGVGSSTQGSFPTSSENLKLVFLTASFAVTCIDGWPFWVGGGVQRWRPDQWQMLLLSTIVGAQSSMTRPVPFASLHWDPDTNLYRPSQNPAVAVFVRYMVDTFMSSFFFSPLGSPRKDRNYIFGKKKQNSF